MRLSLSAATLALLLASCVAPPAPAPVLSGNWEDWPLAPGSWTYRPEQGGSAALFGPAASQASLLFRCELAARRVRVERAGAMTPGAAQMIVRTTFGLVQWPATAEAAPAPRAVAVRAAGDSALDQIVFSRGRFLVDVPGLPPLVVPAWPEVARVIEDCRG